MRSRARWVPTSRRHGSGADRVLADRLLRFCPLGLPPPSRCRLCRAKEQPLFPSRRKFGFRRERPSVTQHIRRDCLPLSCASRRIAPPGSGRHDPMEGPAGTVEQKKLGARNHDKPLRPPKQADDEKERSKAKTTCHNRGRASSLAKHCRVLDGRPVSILEVGLQEQNRSREIVPLLAVEGIVAAERVCSKIAVEQPCPTSDF